MNGASSIGLADWMVDTFIYTSLLIALVLLVRRPVSRWCGPQVAYALWALPFLRFVMPPIVLPAWMAPVEAPASAPVAQPVMIMISDPAQTASSATETVVAPMVGLAVTHLLLPLWVGGALIFIGWRIRDYVQMRRQLLEDSVPVGDAGKVRLVETPAVTGPVAFGIADKVVALPPAFMAYHDIKARDMAIAHELAHHRGHDLVANLAAQPLLALHWFNPLAWWGWRAMRRDQEAACDARVVAGRARSERAAYARVIASFAAGEHLALAAPMACPVLGEKSIIHRLRSLTMSDISSGRRRLGIAAITTTALALPLTASITYAQADAPLPPEAPTAPQSPEPPLPPEAPEPPLPPAAPATDGEDEHIIVEIDDETGERRVIRRHNVREGSEHHDEEIEAMVERLEAEMERREAEIEMVVRRAQERAQEAANGAERASERAAHTRAMVASLGEEFDCDSANGNRVIERDLGNGRKATIICETENYERIAHESAKISMEAAIVGLRAAMEALRDNEIIPAGERVEALREMRGAIRELESETRNLRRTQASLGMQLRSAPHPRGSTVAVRWQGRMVSPVQAISPVRVEISAPSTDEHCESDKVRAAITTRA